MSTTQPEIDSPAEFDAMSEPDRADLLDWITRNITPAKRYFSSTSYGLKHAYEADRVRYVSNGQFKGAMLAAGHAPRAAHERNWEFRIRKPLRETDRPAT